MKGGDLVKEEVERGLVERQGEGAAQRSHEVSAAAIKSTAAT
jgi:hypothetical protein